MTDTVDLMGDGAVIKKIVRQAKADALGPSEDLPFVDVHYEDNFVFSLELGRGSVIQAWDIALRTMKELKRQRELAAAVKEKERRKREEAKAAAAARIQVKLESRKVQGKGKGKGK